MIDSADNDWKEMFIPDKLRPVTASIDISRLYQRPYVKFKKVREGAIVPRRATTSSAGFDVFACITESMWFPGGEVANALLIPTGIALDMTPMQTSMVAYIFPRSGMGHKEGFTLGNGVGVIDSDYQGEIMVSLVRRGNQSDYTLKPGDRIAQLVFMPIFVPPMIEVQDFDAETTRGAGGFGSTGG